MDGVSLNDTVWTIYWNYDFCYSNGDDDKMNNYSYNDTLILLREQKKQLIFEFLEDLKDIIAMDSYWRPIHDKANEKYKKWEGRHK